MDFRDNFFGYAQLNHRQFNEQQTGSRGTVSPSGALQEDHAVEDGADLRAVSAHRFFEEFRSR